MEITRLISLANDGEFDPISGARVWIHSPSSSIQLQATGRPWGVCAWAPTEESEKYAHLDDFPGGCYVGTVPLAAQPGQRYGLTAILPSGAVFSGETNAPMPPSLSVEGGGRVVVRSSSADGDRESRFSVTWRRGPDAAAIDLRVLPGVPYSGGEPVTGGSCSGQHLGRKLEPSGSVEYDKWDLIFRKVGTKGPVTGVFGAITTTEVPIVIVRGED